jgi:hypothetical protein
VVSTPLKNITVVSWDDYSQYMGKQKNVPNHQPDMKYIKVVQMTFENLSLFFWGQSSKTVIVASCAIYTTSAVCNLTVHTDPPGPQQ